MDADMTTPLADERPLLENLAETLEHIPALSAEEVAAIMLAASNDLVIFTGAVADLAKVHAEDFIRLTADHATRCVDAMTLAIVAHDAAAARGAA